MKTVLSLLVVLAGSSAFANYGYTTGMTCHEARQIVQREGSVLLYTSAYIYDRYVSSQYYCPSPATDYTEPAWVKTSDSDNCYIGYICLGRNPNGG